MVCVIVYIEIGFFVVLYLMEIFDFVVVCGEVVVCIEVVGVNLIDVKLCSGKCFFLFIIELCFVGFDGVGVVELFGEGVDDFVVGDWVVICDGVGIYVFVIVIFVEKFVKFFDFVMMVEGVVIGIFVGIVY